MRDFLQNFPTEKVDIYDKEDNKITEVNGLFGTTSLIIVDTSIPLFEEQIVLRTLPNGIVEKYEISECKYVRGHGSIPDFYKLTLVKNNFKSIDVQKYIYNDNSIHIGDNNIIDKSILGNNNK